MLATGVASTTPVNHANNNPLTTENENIVNNYTEQFVQVNTARQDYSDYYNQQYTDTEIKTNYSVNSPYINVHATKYETRAVYVINSQNCLGYANENVISSQESKNYLEKITRTTYVIQITPYNYNLDTESTIVFETKIGVLTDQYNYQTKTESKYLNKQVYTSTEQTWSQYLDKQIVKYQSNVLINDIEDVNNNFYYTKAGSKTEIQNTTEFIRINEETELRIVPNVTNYFVIDYVMSVIAYEYDPFNDTKTYFQDDMVPCQTDNYEFQTITITGTNIIPGGTYEVIDIPGLMWEILTMPFSFVSQAFNLTLFPGTPYQVNISNLFLSIVAVLVFVWLITFFLKMKG